MAATFSVETFSPDRASDFRRLNLEWIERYFSLEPADAKILDDPAGQIIAAGGEIFFALEQGVVVGTCAVRPIGDGRVELSKMAVTPAVQGHGIGRALLDAAIDWFRHQPGDVLFLESHHKLKPALGLYRSAGFAVAKRPDVSDYARCDVYMEFRDPADAESAATNTL